MLKTLHDAAQHTAIFTQELRRKEAEEYGLRGAYLPRSLFVFSCQSTRRTAFSRSRMKLYSLGTRALSQSQVLLSRFWAPVREPMAL